MQILPQSPQAQTKRRPFPTQASSLPRRKQIPRLCFVDIICRHNFLHLEDYLILLLLFTIIMTNNNNTFSTIPSPSSRQQQRLNLSLPSETTAMDTSTSPVATTPAAAATTKSPWKNPSSDVITFPLSYCFPRQTSQ
jgi:hypothetical protein